MGTVMDYIRRASIIAQVRPRAIKHFSPELADIPDDQLGAHFKRCAAAGICPWEMAQGREERCDDNCGPYSGCRFLGGRGGLTCSRLT